MQARQKLPGHCTAAGNGELTKPRIADYHDLPPLQKLLPWQGASSKATHKSVTADTQVKQKPQWPTGIRSANSAHLRVVRRALNSCKMDMNHMALVMPARLKPPIEAVAEGAK